MADKPRLRGKPAVIRDPLDRRVAELRGAEVQAVVEDAELDREEPQLPYFPLVLWRGITGSLADYGCMR